MRRNFKLFLWLFCMNSIIAVHAQNDAVQFEKTIEYQDYRDVYFTLDHQATEADEKYLKETFMERGGIVDFSLQDGKFCKMGIKYDVTTDDVSAILNQFNFKISTDQNISGDNDNKTTNYPPHYPQRVSTGDPQKDELIFKKAFESWKAQYPEEYDAFKSENK